MDDVQRIQGALSAVQTTHREQRRPGSKPWRAKTHVGWIRSTPTIDLNELGGAGLARRVVRDMERIGDELETGAVTFIIGRGKVGPHGAVGTAVREELEKTCGRHESWSIVSTGHLQYTLITDLEKAPPAAKNELGRGFYALAGVFGLAVLVAIANWIGLI